MYVCKHKHCIRESFTFDNPREWVGAVIIVLISMFANAGGLGAGAVIIPVYIFVYGFAPTDSIPLSKITIFAGAIASVLFGWSQRRDNDKNKFLISYEMAAAMIPLLLCGTMIGVLASKFLPPSVVTALLVAYLLYSTWKMFAKAVQTTKKENAQRAMANGDLASPEGKKAIPSMDSQSTDNVSMPSNLESDSNLSLPQSPPNGQ